MSHPHDHPLAASRIVPGRLALVACHRLPERSLHWRGRQLPVCARCTGIVLGWSAYPCFVLGLAAPPVWAALAAIVPALLDGGTQALGWRTSTNPLRVVTGVLAGVGQAGIVAWAAAATARLLLALF